MVSSRYEKNLYFQSPPALPTDVTRPWSLKIFEGVMDSAMIASVNPPRCD